MCRREPARPGTRSSGPAACPRGRVREARRRRDRGGGGRSRVGAERDTEAAAGSGRQSRRRRPSRRGRRGQENGAGGRAQEAEKPLGRAGSGLSAVLGQLRGWASDSGGGGRPGVSRRCLDGAERVTLCNR